MDCYDIMNWYYHKHLGLNMLSFWKGFSSLFCGAILPAIYCLVCMLYIDTDTVFTFFIVGVGLVLVYMMSMWLVGMNNDEKNMLRKLFSKGILKDV